MNEKNDTMAIILASHGRFAEEALRTTEMVIGKQENVGVLSVTEEKDLQDCLPELEDICKQLDTGRGLMILVDMYGGTPCNAGSSLLLRHQDEIDMELLSGFSLPMLLEVFINRAKSPAELKAYITELYPQMFRDLKKILNEEEDSDADQLG